MKLFVGIKDLDDLPPLIAEGAEEFYTGFLEEGTAGTRSHYKASAGLRTRDQLHRALEVAHAAGAKLHIAINTIYYGERELAGLADRVEDVVRQGVDGIIVGSVPLLIQLGPRRLPTEICLSTLQPAFTGEALRFFKQFGLTRIALPDHVGAYEIPDILADPDIKTETLFWPTSMHFFTESFCVFHHLRRVYLNVDDQAPFDYCLERPVIKTPGGRDDPESMALFERLFDGYRCYRINDSYNIYDLHRLGLDYLKLGTREFSRAGKIAAVRVANHCRALLADPAIGRDDFVRLLQEKVDQFPRDAFHVAMTD